MANSPNESFTHSRVLELANREESSVSNRREGRDQTESLPQRKI